MIRPLIAVLGIGLGLSACTPRPPASAASSPPAVVFFDWDKSTLSPQAMATIRQVAASYRSSGARITTVGNTDTSGPTDYNMALSIRRADAVKRAMMENGVPAAAIDT